MRTRLIFPFCFVAVVLFGRPTPEQSAALEKKFNPAQAPATPKLLLKSGDRLAICGDSITEQKMYSRIMEDYLTMCVPELDVTVRQYGWSGERAPGFLKRMTNDCLRFHPTIATTCYGMNDHEYRSYEPRIGTTYQENSVAIIEAFKAEGARVVQGSPGCVGKKPTWTGTPNAAIDDLNSNLCTLRNIGVEIAHKENVGFADVFWPMISAGAEAESRYGTNYAIAGKDGVHPGWAGHTVMAYAFLKGLGLDGEIGKFTVDLSRNSMMVSEGHEMLSGNGGEFRIRSSRYPFCACVPNWQTNTSYPVCGKDDIKSDHSIRSGMALVPFNEELNRFVLVAKNGKNARFRVTWGAESRSFGAEELAKGINLAAEFPANPFTEAFAKVDARVIAKQAYETRQIKQLFHGSKAKTEMEEVVAESERERQPLADVIKAAFVPVEHTIRISPE
jgi:lysophospholipase L1-like esterase